MRNQIASEIFIKLFTDYEPKTESEVVDIARSSINAAADIFTQELKAPEETTTVEAKVFVNQPGESFSAFIERITDSFASTGEDIRQQTLRIMDAAYGPAPHSVKYLIENLPMSDELRAALHAMQKEAQIFKAAK